MALKFSRLTLIPVGVLLTLPSCGKKTAENEGFLPKLSEIQKSDVVPETTIAGESLWKAVAALLEVQDMSGDETAVLTGIKTPSTLITDTTKATAAAGAKVTEVVGTAAQQSCNAGATTGPFLTDLTAVIASGLTAKGITVDTGGFKIDATTGAPTNLGVSPYALKTKVYLMAYRLKSDTDVAATDMRYAFLSVPQTLYPAIAVQPDTTGGTPGYPLALYAHASTGGVSFGEIAKITGDMQLNHIILAPAFPGEKICISPDASGACTDDINKTSLGTSKPYQNDVTDLLGAYECVRGKLVTGGTFTQLALDGSVTTPVPAITSFAKISHVISSGAGSYAGAPDSLKAVAGQPVTYTIGLGRGANVIALAAQRAGAVNSIVTSTATDANTTGAKSLLTTAGLYYPEAFSCTVSAGGNYSFAHGKNKVFLNYWVAGYSDFIPTDSQAALEAIPGFKEVHATIAAIRDDAAKDEATKAAEIAAYVKSIDSTYLMSLYHGSVGNWGKLYNAKFFAGAAAQAAGAGSTDLAATYGSYAKKTLAVAQGAGLVMNGTKDVVADISNSMLFSGIGAAVTAAIATEKAATSSTSPLAGLGGVNWLGLAINEDGSDHGHVSDTSFLAGKSITKTASGMTSTVDEADYLDKIPNDIIKAWLATECQAKSVKADVVTN